MNAGIVTHQGTLHAGLPSAAASLFQVWQRTVDAAPTAAAVMDVKTSRVWTRAEIQATAVAWADEYGQACDRQTVALAEVNGADWLKIVLGLLHRDAVILPLDPGDPAEAQRATAAAVGATRLWRDGKLESIRNARPAPRNPGRLIKLTSGSTGTPRALVFTDAQLIADGRQVCTAMGIQPADINFGLIPWGHSYGLGNLILPLVLQGTAIVFGAAPLPQAMATAIQTWQPTVFPAVPALLRSLVDATVDPAALQSLRTIISAGAPLDPAVAEAFYQAFRRKIHNFYGSSETGGISFDRTGESARLGRGVGHLIPGVTLEYQRGGRFKVRSAAVFTIGNRQPGAHRMADIARLQPDGELVLLGRAGRFVKIAGRRLNLAEVERALKQVPGVKDALVTPHPERADALAAVLSTLRSSSEIRDELRTQLAPWKIPKRILTLAEFPVTSRGKTDTRRLRALLGASSSSG